MSAIGTAVPPDTRRASLPLSIVAPALDERDNVPILLERLAVVARSIGRFEVIIVDDGSTDGTLEFLREASDASRWPFDLHVVARTRSDGVLDAILDGARNSSREYVVFMDSDLQHPPETVAELWRAGAPGGLDAVVASRYARGSLVVRMAHRGLLSRGAVLAAHLALPVSRGLSDPTSGFFLIRRSLVSALRPMRGRCKALLYAMVMNDGLRIAEVPYRFSERAGGQSKLVGSSLAFLRRYLIEVLTYRKIRPSNRGRFSIEGPPVAGGRAAGAGSHPAR